MGYAVDISLGRLQRDMRRMVGEDKEEGTILRIRPGEEVQRFLVQDIGLVGVDFDRSAHAAEALRPRPLNRFAFGAKQEVPLPRIEDVGPAAGEPEVMVKAAFQRRRTGATSLQVPLSDQTGEVAGPLQASCDRRDARWERHLRLVAGASRVEVMAEAGLVATGMKTRPRRTAYRRRHVGVREESTLS